MKKFILGLLVYLLGCFCAYQIIKADTERDLRRWTVKDRTFVLMMSSTSWIGVAAGGLIWVMGDAKTNDDAPANW